MIGREIAAWGEAYREYVAQRVAQAEAEANGEPLPYNWGYLDDDGITLLYQIASLLGEDDAPDREDTPE